jgi:outer membrane protein assembly factor BamB
MPHLRLPRRTLTLPIRPSDPVKSLNTMHPLQRWAVAALVLFLAACSKDKDIDVPAQLSPIKQPTLKIEQVWSGGAKDKAAARLRLGLALAVDGSSVYTANHKGDVEAVNLKNGHQLWRARIRAPLSAGPAASADLVVVGTSAGEVIALQAASGQLLWRVRLNGEILSAPTIAAHAIAVRTVDGKIHGLAPSDGHELWSQEQQVPRLSLRGTSRPVINGDVAVCGFDNGKVMAVNMNDGTVQWEATISPPHGKTELERLSDIDSTVRVAGQDVYAVGFQGKIAMLSLDNGQVWWSHDASSYRSMGIDDEDLYVATSDGEVVAMRRRTGAELWRQKALLHRGLSAIATTDTSLIVGDFQGYVHWLDKATGSVQARVRSGKMRISNAPVVVGNMVLVGNDYGRIAVYRVTPITPPAPKQRAKPPAQAPKQQPTAPQTQPQPTSPQAQPQPTAPQTQPQPTTPQTQPQPTTPQTEPQANPQT